MIADMFDDNKIFDDKNSSNNDELATINFLSLDNNKAYMIISDTIMRMIQIWLPQFSYSATFLTLLNLLVKSQ